MSRKKLIRVVATIHHQGLAPGQDALVDANDEDVQALLAGGYLLAVGKGEEPAEEPPSAAGGTESDPNAPLPAGDLPQEGSPSQGGSKPAEGR